ncbi:MAG: choice-of-anchor B family protein [Bacteroidetes bacterium]|nr:MAG: choice-of-anchor B family protein [Bacteroidota bacterium]
MKLFILLLYICLCLVLSSTVFSQNGLTFVGHLDQKHGTSGDNVSYSACWGYVAPNGREYAIVGTYTGTSIIDITNTDSIREITHISGPSSIWREMRTYKERAYVVSEGGSGVQIINLENLPNSASLVRSFNYTSGVKNILRNHSIEIFDGYMYLNGSANWSPGGVLIFNLANVDTPAYVGQYQQEYCHDSYVKGNRLYAAAINSGGLNIANISNKSAPSHITKITYSGAGTHNAWTTTDGNTVITTDEIGSTAKNLKFWNVTTIPPAPSSPIATYTVSPSDIVHNVFVRGKYVYVAWYTAGIAVVDVSNASSPATAGHYDTSFEPSGNYDGVWAVYPYFWSGKVIAGDMQNGLYVLRHDSLLARSPVTLLEPSNQQAFCSASSIQFKWTRVADPARDPHVYWFSLEGAGVDTTYILSTDTTFTLNNIASLANGTYSWYITTKDEATQIATRDTFSFLKTDPFVKVVSPDTNAVLKAESDATITWSAPCIDSIEISFSTDNGVSWTLIAGSLPASGGSYVWAVPNIATTEGRVRVRSKSDTTLSDMSDSPVTIFLSTNVSLLSPNGGEIWEEGTTNQISWSFLNVSDVALEYSTNGGSSWETIIADTAASAGAFNWFVPVLGATTEAIVRIRDFNNPATADTSDAPFTIHHTAVAVYLTAPNGGEIWKVGTEHAISWSVIAVDSIRIEYSSDNGGAWETIVPAIAASEGSFLWTVNVPSAKNALIRIRSLSDSSIVDSSSAPFQIPLEEMSVASSWNLASVPVLPEEASVSSIFEEAASPAFEYQGTYAVLETVKTGKGFWIKYNEDSSIPLYGSPTSQETIAVSARWNILGSLTNPFPASSLEPIPDSMTLSTLYRYDPDSGYMPATTILPGKGYWLKTSQAGQLVLGSSFSKIAQLPQEVQPAVSEMMFRDARGRTRTVCISDEGNENANALSSELPPPPPAGAFDVRFASQRQAETLAGERISAAIEIRSAEYPLSVTLLNAHGERYRLIVHSRGENRKEYELTASSSIVLQSAPEGMVMLEKSNGEELPSTFALQQNFPNPFNPTTIFSFHLPVSSYVTLKVYNVLGEEVATIIDGMQDAGVKSMQWNASGIPSGVYMYKLTAGNPSSGSGQAFVDVKNLILLK